MNDPGYAPHPSIQKLDEPSQADSSPARKKSSFVGSPLENPARGL
jgi:hypothetical protein